MNPIAGLLNFIGFLLLTHAVYSAHEHSALFANLPPTAAPTGSPAVTSLPTDIVLETLASVVVLCVGIVLASPPLKPIQWRVWAGRIEREERMTPEQKARLGNRRVGGPGTSGNPFRVLEERMGFWDVRSKRKEFADWVREGGKS
ncbi:magnesium transporter [Lineolata rhizophorae]|uniref:Magnesium transporter n=1 Tax=Lineolata rhizophorae TaxID=578093 RepID=A0A6A6PAZ7_9PEZI|nr:magnesium transporter [Lineolata rhizophorae]